MANENGKSLEAWIWDAACSIRGAKDAAKYKHYILPLIFTKRLCDVFDDEVDRIAKEVSSRKKAFQLTKADWRKAAKSRERHRCMRVGRCVVAGDCNGTVIRAANAPA